MDIKVSDPSAGASAHQVSEMTVPSALSLDLTAEEVDPSSPVPTVNNGDFFGIPAALLTTMLLDAAPAPPPAQEASVTSDCPAPSPPTDVLLVPPLSANPKSPSMLLSVTLPAKATTAGSAQSAGVNALLENTNVEHYALTTLPHAPKRPRKLSRTCSILPSRL
jgi:hypothetical protein